MKRVWILAILLILTACAAPIAAPSEASPAPTASLTPVSLETPAETPITSAAQSREHIAFVFRAENEVRIYVINADGTGLKLLVSLDEGDSDPGWSPDDRQLVFRRTVYDAQNKPLSAIYIMNADGSGLKQLVPPADWNDHPDWSPDGERIAFVTFGPQEGGLDIFSVNVNSGKFSQITNDPLANFNISWSPDGQRLAFRAQEDVDEPFDLFITDPLNSAEPINLTEKYVGIGNVISMAWSPDGDQIAFTGYESEDTSDIYTINVDGAELTRLTDSPDSDMFPVWSPDGSQIAFVSDREGYDAIYIMNADGSGAMRITDNITGIGRYTLGKLNWLADEQ